jgi:hypothetical protein
MTATTLPTCSATQPILAVVDGPVYSRG